MKKGSQYSQTKFGRKSQTKVQQNHKLPTKRRKTWLWIIGWLCIFPLPLTIILIQKKNMKPAMKYSIIIVAWIFYIIIGLAFNAGNSNNITSKQTEKPVVVESTQTEKSDTNKSEESSTLETMDEMTALQAFYDDFSSSGTLDNLKEMVSQYHLYTDHRKDGIGHDTYKVAYTEEWAKVISNFDLETEGNYIVIKFNLLKNNSIDSIVLHTDDNDVNENTTNDLTEMNSLLKLFASLNMSTTRKDIDDYISENGLVKYAFTHDSAYFIGYDEAAIRTRGRDREGEAVDIDFVTSGNTNIIGTIKSAEYAVHTGFNTHTKLKFDNGIFYYEGNACDSGLDAVQKFLDNNQ